MMLGGKNVKETKAWYVNGFLALFSLSRYLQELFGDFYGDGTCPSDFVCFSRFPIINRDDNGST